MRWPKNSTDLKPGIYVGAGVSALFLLLPYVMLTFVFLPAYVLGPLAGVWFELRHGERRLDFTQWAQLGFYSTFYGTVAAIVLTLVVTRFSHEQVWRLENIYRPARPLANKGLNSDTPSDWYVWIVGTVTIVIFAGAVGAFSGKLGLKLLQRSSRP